MIRTSLILSHNHGAVLAVKNGTLKRTEVRFCYLKSLVEKDELIEDSTCSRK